MRGTFTNYDAIFIWGACKRKLKDIKIFFAHTFRSFSLFHICFSLATDEPVVRFDQGQKMVVNYNPRLINLVKEVRLLSLKGYTIPSEIKDTAKQASKFSTQALSLSQVSSYKHLYAPEKLEVI